MTTECIAEPVYRTSCDKCGVVRDHGANLSVGGWRHFTPPSNAPDGYARSVDLCPACVKDLRAWLGLRDVAP